MNEQKFPAAKGPLFANRRIRINPGVCKLVKRSLKGPGTILAQKNTEIAPHDIIGRYKVTAGFSVVNLAKELNVSPGDVSKYLQKPVGKTVFKGELLASRKTLFSNSQIVAPNDSIFENLNETTGEARFKMIPKDVSLTSGVFGVIENVDQEQGEITIRCMMTEVYGVFGTGSDKEGFLKVISGPGDLVNSSKITEENKGQILVAGALIMEETIKKALSCNVNGIICGGLNMDDYLAMAGSFSPGKKIGTEIGISIIATEGFGLLPIGEDLQEIFLSYNSRFAMINGNLGRLLLPSNDADSILSCRKVSLPTVVAQGVKPELTISEIRPGVKVRLIWPPFMGAQGIVDSLDSSPTSLESGISTYLLTVETRSRKIRVPYSNVEVIS